MNRTLELLLRIAIVALSVGCQTQRGASKSDINKITSEVNYKLALNALGSREFSIEARERYDPSNETQLTYSTTTYISMQGDKAIYKSDPKKSPERMIRFTKIEDDSAEITKGEKLKNGNMEYRMTIQGEKYHQREDIVIELYENSNECSVIIKHKSHKRATTSFKGVVLPLTN